MDFSEIKTLEQIDEGINKLLSIKSSDEDAYDRMFEIIKHELHPIPFPVINLIANHPEPYVDRVVVNNKNEICKNISRISSHHDSSKIKSFGRCNTPFQSTFYCAENRGIATMEVLKKELVEQAKYITLTNGRWRVLKPMTLGMLVHGEDAARNNPYINQRFQQFENHLQNKCPVQKPAINRLLNFFSEYFSRPFNDDLSNEYKLSAAFYNYVIAYCDGLIYPSVKSRYVGLNYAFPHEKYIDGYVKLDRVLMNVLKRKEENDFEDFLQIVDQSIYPLSDFIRWNTRELIKFEKFN